MANYEKLMITWQIIILLLLILTACILWKEVAQDKKIKEIGTKIDNINKTLKEWELAE